MAALGNVGAGSLIGTGDTLTRANTPVISKALRMGLLGALDPMVTDAGLASGVPSPSVLPTGAVVGELSLPTDIIGVVG